MESVDAGSLLLRGLDAVEASTASTREATASNSALHAEIREHVRASQASHAELARRVDQLGSVVERLAIQMQRSEDRLDREATQAEEARRERRSLLARGVAAAWALPELRILIVLALAGWLGVQTQLIQIGIARPSGAP